MKKLLKSLNIIVKSKFGIERFGIGHSGTLHLAYKLQYVAGHH